MQILAIDPGTTKSAYMIFDTKNFCIEKFDWTDNEKLVDLISLGKLDATRLISEVVKSYGNVMGDSLLETCVWIGRFQQAFGAKCFTPLTRKQIVAHICKNPRARDANVRQALIDRFPQTGGGKTPSIGTKAKPGPLYGITGDVWSALAVAVTFTDLYAFLD